LRWLETTLQDLLFAIRMLRRSPGFTALAVATMALGIGSNTAIFSVVHALLLKPLPYHQPDRLVALSEGDPAATGLGHLSFATARDLRSSSRTIESVSFFGDMSPNLIENGVSEVLRGQRVSANFFDTLGVKPQLGRVFEFEDTLPGRNNVIVLTHTLWKVRFGADPAIIGRVLQLNNQPVRVIGVMPASFAPLHMSNPGELPMAFRPFDETTLESLDRASGSGAIARLKPEVTAGQSRAELNTILRKLIAENPLGYAPNAVFTVEPLQEKLTRHVRTALWVLAAAVGMVLLIACANMANLQLTRATARETEIALRAALGCGQWRIARQLLTESLFLSLIGGVAGVLLAWPATAALAALAPTEIPRAGEIGIDSSVLIFAFAASVVSGVLFGLAPALRSGRLDLNDALRSGRDLGGGRPRLRLRYGLVISEIACAFLLTAGAGLLAHSFGQIMRVNAGYDPHNILTLTALVYGARYNQPDGMLEHFRQLLERIEAIQGVEAAGMVNTLPLSSPTVDYVSAEERPPAHDADAPVADKYFASPGYFRALRIPLKRGRLFGDQDRFQAPRVAVISESCSRLLFGTQDPIGRRIRVNDDEGNAQMALVIGIVGDVWQHSMEEGPSLGVYLPQSQNPYSYYRLVVRTIGDPWRVLPAVRAAFREVDPTQPIFHIQPMDAYVTKSLADRISTLSLISLLGTLALALAGIGIYGAVSYAVSLRTHELGVRMALGADRADILGLVMRWIISMLAWGLAIGTAAALAFSRFLTDLLFHVDPMDLVSTGSAALLLSCAALAAGYFPCRRALKVDPSQALRYE
jgi:putative ABC transport system permease protein